ncbi:MAG: hypothetical protein Q8R55_07460, partial [Candidatus Taylorbacteria bacterium]|nr:hypothetical protein [Candidatus Taylorbacteria bacterium]
QDGEIVWQKMWHTDWDGKSGENEQREFDFSENKVGHPRLDKELPFNFDKEAYKTLVTKLLENK